MIDAHFVNMSFICCEEGLLYRRRLRDAIDAGMEVRVGDPQMQYWFWQAVYGLVFDAWQFSPDECIRVCGLLMYRCVDSNVCKLSTSGSFRRSGERATT